MALDGILLHKVVFQLQSYLPMRIQKIYQISNTEILFHTHGSHGKQQLLISTHSVYNRLLITNKSYPTPAEPSHFVMVLRKYLEGSFITSITQAGLDRWCTFTIQRTNDLGDKENLWIYVELMGKYANIILVNQENRIIDALKRIPPFENSQRTIHPGSQFVQTPSQQKKDPFQDQQIEEEKSLTAQFAGFSPFLSKEVEYRMVHGQSFDEIMQEIADSQSLYIQIGSDHPEFHCLALTHLGPCKKTEIFSGFDEIYFHQEEKDRIKQMTGNIGQWIQRQYKHQDTKLPRLKQEYEQSLYCDRYRLYGDLLFTHQVLDTKGQKSITLPSFEDDQPITIPLDPKLDGKANAQKHYHKYNKLKKAQQYLQQQIAICENERQYFAGLLEQLEQADYESATQIQQELIHLGYLQVHQKKNQKQKKQKILGHHLQFKQVDLYYGKNNLQNEAVTWNARKEYYWLHAKDFHGAHVIIASATIEEEVLRFAANLAAYFSKGRYSSSVPVNYTQVKNLKKIPGAKPGMVELKTYKTIYIDPDPEQLLAHGVTL